MKSLIITILLFVASIFSYGQNYGKMSPWLRKEVKAQIVKALLQKEEAGSKRKGVLINKEINNINEKKKERIIPTIIKCEDKEAITRCGGKILRSWGNKHVVLSTPSQLSRLSEEKSVERIEAGRLCKTTNDLSSEITNARKAKETIILPDGKKLSGEGIVVGTMDIGFDLTHPTFWSEDMSRYRIKAIWDQLDFSENGKEVKGEDTVYVGRQYTVEEEIIKKGCSVDAHIETHGTHTLGTSAGSGSEGYSKGKYQGMAPESDICLVANLTSNNISLISEDSLSLYNFVTDLLGFQYIFDYAEKEGKPCVINFSEGSKDYFFDTQLYNEILSEMVGKGRILCSSAGNEALKTGYFRKEEGILEGGTFLTNSNKHAMLTTSSTKPLSFSLSFFNSKREEKKFTYTTHDLIDKDSTFCDTIKIDNSLFIMELTAYTSCYDENKTAAEIILSDTLKNISESDIFFTVYGEDNDIETFALSGSFEKKDYNLPMLDISNDHNILFPGSNKDVICVGATIYKSSVENMYGDIMSVNLGEEGKISDFSSRGPSLSGITKPDVVAPGTNIISSYGSQYYEANKDTYPVRWSVREFTYNNRKYLWAATHGTSMSCPMVTGIIALWLQICPTLSPNDIRDIIAHTSNHIDPTLLYPNNIYGYGEIDALEGIKYIEKTYTGIEHLFPEDTLENTEKEYYDLSGRKVINTRHPGIYVSKKGKILVR